MATRKVFEAKVTLKLVDHGEDESAVDRWLSNRLSALQDVEEACVDSVERVDADDEDEEKSDSDLLEEIADKLDRLAPNVSGMDQYHSDSLRSIAAKLRVVAPPTDEERAKIKAEYLSKREAYFTLVGTLYPGIAYEELMKLRERYVAGTESYWCDLPPTSQPREDGSAPSPLDQADHGFQSGDDVLEKTP